MSDNSGLALVNEALVRIGTRPLGSFADQSAQALAAENIYSRLRDSLLADHPWAFAIREALLSEITTTAPRLLVGKHIYQLPGDCLRVLGLRTKDQFWLAGDQMYTDVAPLQSATVYVSAVTEEAFPAYFRELLVTELCVAFATAVTDNPDRAAIYERRLTNYVRMRVRAIDSQQMPPEVFDLMKIYVSWSNNPLVAA